MKSEKLEVLQDRIKLRDDESLARAGSVKRYKSCLHCGNRRIVIHHHDHCSEVLAGDFINVSLAVDRKEEPYWLAEQNDEKEYITIVVPHKGCEKCGSIGVFKY